MSRFAGNTLQGLIPYVPGEQPRERKYLKLNTNENPFPPSEKAISFAFEAAKSVMLYSDPTAQKLNQALASRYGVSAEEVITTNGSDEILNFCFMAFCDETRPIVFPNYTYGFYPVFADLNGIPYREIPLREDFSVNVSDYIGIHRNIVIANPNAPTGLALPLSDIEKIVASNPDHIVIVDEAYVDFGAESAVPLIHRYDNLIVTQTFSKSRSMAGARLGFGIACKELIADLNTVRFSTNPYNVNSMTMAAGIGTLADDEYTQKNCRIIIESREMTEKKLSRLGFVFPQSSANFIFAKHPAISGKNLYLALRERGVLVRHFDKKGIEDYNRITVGTPEQMRVLIEALKTIPEIKKGLN